jgi:hypothetical protein
MSATDNLNANLKTFDLESIRQRLDVLGVRL